MSVNWLNERSRFFNKGKLERQFSSVSMLSERFSTSSRGQNPILKLTSLLTLILKVFNIGKLNYSTSSSWFEFKSSSDNSNYFDKFLGNLVNLFEPRFKYSKLGKNGNSEEDI